MYIYKVGEVEVKGVQRQASNADDKVDIQYSKHRKYNNQYPFSRVLRQVVLFVSSSTVLIVQILKSSTDMNLIMIVGCN